MPTKKMLPAIVMLALTGCHSGRDVVPDPTQITLQDALVGTVRALNAAYVEARKGDNQVMGYYPCTLTATYKISAGGTTENKISGGATGGPPGLALSVNAGNTDTYTGNRDNTVEAVFASSLCLPTKAETGASAAASAKPSRPGKQGAGEPGNATQPPRVVFDQHIPLPPMLQ